MASISVSDQPAHLPSEQVIYIEHNLRGDVLKRYYSGEAFMDEYPRPRLGDAVDQFVRAYGYRADDLWTIYDYLVTTNQYVTFRAHMWEHGMPETMTRYIWHNAAPPSPPQTYTFSDIVE